MTTETLKALTQKLSNEQLADALGRNAAMQSMTKEQAALLREAARRIKQRP